jgi:hypothetical protein
MTKLIVALALALAVSPALAQKKMYRCGNVFQERPCEGPKEIAQPVEKATPAVLKEQELAAKREEREKSIHQAKCENYSEELGDVRRRIKVGGTSDTVTDQLQRREKEMVIRIGRECK